MALSRDDGLQLHVEIERGARGDGADVPIAVAQVGWYHDLTPLTHLHGQQSLVPALDDLADAHLELQGLAPVTAGVELLLGLEVLQPAWRGRSREPRKGDLSRFG